MPGVPDPSKPSWEQFLEHLEPCDEFPTTEAAEAELRQQGVNVDALKSRVLEAVHQARARAELARAKAQLPGVRERVTNAPVSATGGTRERLKALIAERCEAAARTAYFRKLDAAANEADLESLLNDLERLDAIPGDEHHGQSSGE